MSWKVSDISRARRSTAAPTRGSLACEEAGQVRVPPPPEDAGDRGAAVDRFGQRCLAREQSNGVPGEPGPHGRELVGALARAGGGDRLDVGVACPRERTPDEREPALALGLHLEPPRTQEPRVVPGSLQGRGQCSEAVADRGGVLVPLGVREAAHPYLERCEEPVRGLEGGEEVPDELSVALGADLAVAGCGAPADAGERAGSEAGPRAHRSRAPAEGDDLLDRLLGEARRARAGERTEVRAAVGVASSVNDLQPGE